MVEKLTGSDFDSFADLLYEFQIDCRGNILGYKDPIGSGFEEAANYDDDYKSFYEYLELQDVLPYEAFQKVARGEGEPSAMLVQYIQVFAQEHAPIWDMRIRGMSALEGQALKKYDNSLARILKDMLSDTEHSNRIRFSMADQVRSFPEQLDAIAENDVIASPELRGRLGNYLRLEHKFPAGFIRILNGQYERWAEEQHEENPDAACLRGVLGAITKTSRVPDLLNDLFQKEFGVSQESLIEEGMDRQALGAVLGNLSNHSRYTYPEDDMKLLMSSLKLNRRQARLFKALAVNRPFADLLEEYIGAGKTNFGGFLRSVTEDWNMPSNELAALIKTERTNLHDWMNPSGKRQVPSHRKIEEMASVFKLDDKKKNLLMSLARGNLELGRTFQEAFDRLCDEMKEIEGLGQRQIFANKALGLLIEQSGIEKTVLARQASCEVDFITARIHREEPHKKIRDATMYKLANALAEQHGQEPSTRDIRLFLLGFPEDKEPVEALEGFLKGQTPLDELLLGYRYRLGLTTKALAHELKYVASKVSAFEYPQSREASQVFLGRIAKHMRLNKQQKNMLVEGEYIQPQPSIEELMRQVQAGEKSVSEVIKRALSDVTPAALAKAMNVGGTSVSGWADGVRIKAKSTAENLAQEINIPSEFTDLFVKGAMGQLPEPYDPSILKSCNRDCSKSRSDTIYKLLGLQKLRTKEVGEHFATNPVTVQRLFRQTGYTSGKIKTKALAAFLIPEKYPKDRALLNEILDHMPQQKSWSKDAVVDVPDIS